MVGVGITPPKVLGTPKPASSVMMSSTFGAPFGGTMRGAHHAFDWRAPSLITPPNFGSGAGSCLPSRVVVALGEPGVPVICWATANAAVKPKSTAPTSAIFQWLRINFCIFILHPQIFRADEDSPGSMVYLLETAQTGYCTLVQYT